MLPVPPGEQSEDRLKGERCTLMQGLLALSLVVLTTLGLIADMNYSHLLFVGSSELMTIWPEILEDLD